MEVKSNLFKNFTVFTLTVALFILVYSQNTAQQNQKNDYQKIWEIQVNGVSTAMKLSADNADQLTKLYLKVRTELRSELNSLPVNEDKNQNKNSSDEIKNKSRVELETGLKSILTPEQFDKYTLLLCSFNPRWDSFISVLSEFKLEEKKFNAGIQHIAEYISEYEKARKDALDSGSRFSASTSRELKSKLDELMSELLNPEQSAKWNEATLIGKSKK